MQHLQQPESSASIQLQLQLPAPCSLCCVGSFVKHARALATLRDVAQLTRTLRPAASRSGFAVMLDKHTLTNPSQRCITRNAPNAPVVFKQQNKTKQTNRTAECERSNGLRCSCCPFLCQTMDGPHARPAHELSLANTHELGYAAVLLREPVEEFGVLGPRRLGVWMDRRHLINEMDFGVQDLRKNTKPFELSASLPYAMCAPAFSPSHMKPPR